MVTSSPSDAKAVPTSPPIAPAPRIACFIAPSQPQSLKILQPKLQRTPFVVLHPLGLQLAQLGPADLSRDCLRQFLEFELSHPLVSSQLLLREEQDLTGNLFGRARIGHDGDEGLWNAGTQGVWTGNNCHFSNQGMLHEDAFQLKGTDSIIGALEDIVAAADEKEVALLVEIGQISRVVQTVLRHDPRELGIVQIARHQACRPGIKRHRDLAFRTVFVLQIDQADLKSRKWSPHAAEFHRLPRRIADECCRLCLAEAIPDDQTPGLLDLFDHLWIQRLTCACQFAQGAWLLSQILPNDHAPDRGRTTQCGDPDFIERAQHIGSTKSRSIVNEGSRAGVERSEEAAPGMLGPPG